MSSLKVKEDKHVYSAMFGEDKVVVKSVDYDADLEQTTEDYMLYVNYMAETLSMASYTPPGVVHSDDMTKLVTMSRFAPGVCPECLPEGEF